MERILRFYYLIEHTQVVQVDILVQKLVYQPHEVVLRLQIPRLYQDRRHERNQRNYENHSFNQYCDLVAANLKVISVDKAEPKRNHNYQVAYHAKHYNETRSFNFPDRTMSLKTGAFLVVTQNEFKAFKLAVIESFLILIEHV